MARIAGAILLSLVVAGLAAFTLFLAYHLGRASVLIENLKNILADLKANRKNGNKAAAEP